MRCHSRFCFIQYTSNIYIDNHNEQKQTVRSQCLDLQKKMNGDLIRKIIIKKVRFANTLEKRHKTTNNQSDRKIYQL